jgi:hypothetical protein
MAGSRGIAGAGGGLGTGLLLLVGGLLVKHSQANMVAECSSGLGQLGQAFDPNAAAGCTGAEDLSSLATAAIWIGAIMLAIAVIGGIAMLAAAGVFVATNKPKAGAATSTRSPAKPATAARPPARSATATATVEPYASQAAPPPSAGPSDRQDPAPPAESGCGHELRPGARFCVVCGGPAAASASP